MADATRTIELRVVDTQYRRALEESTRALERHKLAAGGTEKSIGKVGRAGETAADGIGTAATAADGLARELDAVGTAADRSEKKTSDFGATLRRLATAAAAYFGLREAVEVTATFEQQLADLSAITGIAGADLDALGQAARAAALETGQSAASQVEAFKLLASNIDLTREELEAMGAEVVTLSVAAGVDLATAANVVAGSINQFGLSAADSGRVVNALAAGSKEGAAEVDDLAAALERSGSVARSAGLSIESTVGALEILAQNGQKGADAGTALRSILTILRTETEKLADAGIQGLNIEADGLAGTLTKLAPLLSDAGAMAAIFGRETIGQAEILIRNASAVDAMTAAVTGTATAQEQAATQTDTLRGDLGRLRGALEETALNGYDGMGASARGLVQDLTALVRALDDNWEAVSATVRVLGVAAVAVKSYQAGAALAAAATVAATAAQGAYTAAAATSTAATGAARAAMIAFNVAVRANPLGLVVSLLATAAAGFLAFRGSVEETTGAFREQRREVEALTDAIGTLTAEGARSRASAAGATTNELRTLIRAKQAELQDLEQRRAGLSEIALGNVGGGIHDAIQRGRIDDQIAQVKADLAELAPLIRQSIYAEDLANDRAAQAAAAPPPQTSAAAILRAETQSPDAAREAEQAAREAEQARQQEAQAQRAHSGTLVQIEEATITAKAELSASARLYEQAQREQELAGARAAAEAEAALIQDTTEQRRRAAEIASTFGGEAVSLALERAELERTLAEERAGAEQAAAEARARFEASPERGDTAGDAARKASELAANLTQIKYEGDSARLEAERAYQLSLGEIRAQESAGEAERLQADTERAREYLEQNIAEYQASAEARAQAVADIEANLAAGLVQSFDAVRGSLSTLGQAYEEAGTDEERARILALVQALDKLAEGFQTTAENAGKNIGHDIADGLAQAVRLADELSRTLSAIGDDAGAAIARGIGDALAGATQLAGGIASGDPKAIVEGGIQTAQAIAGLYGTLSAQREALAANREALADSVAATRANTDALLSGQVGSDVTAQAVQAALSGLNAAREAVAGIRAGLFGGGVSEARDAIEDYFDRLDAEGLDTADLRRQFADAMALGGRERRDALFNLLDDVGERFEAIAESFGEYGSTLEGAAERAADAMEYAGATAAEALALFAETLRGTEIGQIVSGLLDDLLAIDTSTQAGAEAYEAALVDFYRRLQAGEIELPDGASQDDIERFLDEARRLSEGGTSGGSSAGSSSAASIQSMSALQANELLAYQQELMRAARGTEANTAAILAEIAGIASAVLAPAGVAQAAAGAGALGGAGIDFSFSLTLQNTLTDREIGEKAGRYIEAQVRRARTTGRGGRTSS